MLKAKKGDEINVEVTLPENFPKKELVGKKSIFKCKINYVKKPKEVEINDEFAKTLGAKDLNDLKKIMSKQINEEFKNSLNIISKSLMSFVIIEPSKTNQIKNNETIILKEISTLLDEKNYKISYKKIITLENYEEYFKETINQIQIANDFKKLINKTI